MQKEGSSKLPVNQRVKSSQIALAWMLHRANNIIVIPGTTTISHLEENVAAASIVLTHEEIQMLNQI